MRGDEAAGNLMSDIWPSSGPCGLCPAVGPLCRSHIIPKFVSDWMRTTNVLGRLRGSDVPNRLAEDLPWRYLLCEECERRFSRFETEICKGIFLPMHEQKTTHFRYGPAFTRFGVSIAWRVLTVMRAEGKLDSLAQMPLSVDAALKTWSEFLLEKRETPAPHGIHAFPIGLTLPPTVSPDEVSPHLGRFLLRSAAEGVACRDGFGYVIVKMGRMSIIGTVESGDQRRVWKGTKLHVNGGAWGDGVRAPLWMFWWLAVAAQKSEDMMDSLSDTQKRKTHAQLLAALRANPKGLAESAIAEGWTADLNLFGARAYQKPFPKD